VNEKISLDSPESKITHISSNGEKKTLLQHIKEIKEISSIILNKHFSDYKNCKDIINILAEKHDTGKLNPEWNVNNERKPPHSVLSAYLYLIENDKYDSILFYLIWKHHSFLKAPRYLPPQICEDFLKFLKHPDIKIDRTLQKKLYCIIKEEIIEKIKKQENYSQNVFYADLFGVFKTGDILSAKFDFKLEVLRRNLRYDYKKIRDMLKLYVEDKGLKFDESKWETWIDLSYSFKNKNLILLAPTGWGKTFAALIIALAHNPSHIIYVLPTITAIRKMKEIIKKFFKDMEVEENYFFADIEMLKKENKEDKKDEILSTELFIAKTFLAPITVTTLDQVLLSFLNVGKYHIKRYHFKNSFIIFDEYHLYPLNGLILLLKILKKFNEDFKYNMKFLFMSATEEPAYTSLITQSIKNIGKQEFLDEYKKLRRYNYIFLEKDMLDEDVIKRIKNCLNVNSKILIILNTVEKAIKMYLKLRNFSTNVLLLHSRFTYQDRRNKEELLERYDKNNKSMILIATQLAEVSLDMSFDYLFTELAPLPSLIQRFGRVNRYGTFTKNINVFITNPIEVQDYKFYPYEKDNIEKTYRVLKTHPFIQNEYKLLKPIQNGELKINIGENLKDVEEYFDKWMEDTYFIYTVDLTEEKMNKILKFRDAHTTLVIPECKEKEALDILSTENKIKNILIKNLLVPVPIGWLWIEKNNVNNIGNIPVLGGEKYIYSPVVGYFDSEKIQLPSDIPVCKDSSLIY